MTKKSNLESDTELQQVGENQYLGVLPEHWGGPVSPSGGFLASLALRSAGLSSNTSRPFSFQCQFLRSPKFGEIQFDVDVLHSGKSTEVMRVSGYQGDRQCIAAFVRGGNVGEGLSYDLSTPPKIDSPDNLKSMKDMFGPSPIPLFNNFDTKPGDNGKAALAGEWGDRDKPHEAWERFSPGAYTDCYLDACRMIIISDITSYRSVGRAMNMSGQFYAPNTDISIIFERLGMDDDWLLVSSATQSGTNGIFNTEITLWNRDRSIISKATSQLFHVGNL